MRSPQHISRLPTAKRTIRNMLLTLLLSNSFVQTGCVPYPNRFQENRDSGTETADASMDASTDAFDADAADMNDASVDAAEVIITDAQIDAPDILDARTDTGIPTDSGDVMDAHLDSGPDSSLVDSGDVIDAGEIVDAGPRDTGVDAATDAGDIVDSGRIDAGVGGGDAGPATWPCSAATTIGPDIILPVTPAPGVTAPFSATLTRSGRIAIVHLSGGHLYYTSVSADGIITYVPTIDVNSDLATMEIGNGVAIDCSGVADQCLVSYVRSAPGDLVDARINSVTGGRIGTENVLSSLTNLTPYQVAFNQLNHTYGITYAQTGGPTPYQAFVSVTGETGIVTRTTGLAEPMLPGTRAGNPSITTFGDSNFMVAFQDSVSGNSEIYMRTLTAAAGVAGVVNVVTTTPEQSQRPSVRTYGNVSTGITEYRIDWIESGNNLATRVFSLGGMPLSPTATTSILGAGTSAHLHSAGQFVAWYNSSELDVSLFSSTAGSVADNQTLERSTFADFRSVIVSNSLLNGRIIYMMTDGFLHMRTLSCR